MARGEGSTTEQRSTRGTALGCVLLGLVLGIGLGCPSGEEDCTDPEGCDEVEPEPDPEPESDLSISISGWVERGSIVQATLRLGDEEVSPGAATWSAEPEDSVAILEGDRFELLQATELTLRAELEEQSEEVSLTVEAPPAVVFQRFEEGEWRLYNVELDGQELWPLMMENQGREPTCSSGTVVFASDREDAWALYTFNVSCMGILRVTDLEADHATPTLNPEGSLLTFSREVDGVPKVFLATAEGQDSRRLAEDLGDAATSEQGPSFSPDGSRVVFSAAPEDSRDLYVAEVDTGAHELLLRSQDDLFDPAWSPCGAYVAYGRDLGGQVDLFLLEIDSGETTRLTDRQEADLDPSWLLDGRLVYSAETETGGFELRWLDPVDPSVGRLIPTGPEEARAPAEMR